jgi:hypothetical protein
MDEPCIKKDILAALTYYGLFNYPLKKGEIFIFLQQCNDMDDFETALNTLVEECIVFKIGNFYSLEDNPALAERRSRGNERAFLLLKKAEKAAAIISGFPFVKGVAVSGSLSKYFADENADVDFFIITDSNRLWIARTFLHGMKKLSFLLNKEDLFCMNYFIDESNLVIREKNIYTAIEISTVLPLRGTGIFEEFFEKNKWAKAFFPNKFQNFSSTNEIKKNWMRVLIQRLLNNRMGDGLDNYLMKLTCRRWQTKTVQGRINSKGKPLNMDLGKHYSKPHPENFQKRLLVRYERSLADNYKRFELSRFLL